MDSGNSILSLGLIIFQVVSMFGLYAYYTRKNKEAEKMYWEKKNSEEG